MDNHGLGNDAEHEPAALEETGLVKAVELKYVPEHQETEYIQDKASKQLTLSILAVCVVTLLIGFTGIALLFSMPVMPISFLAWMAGLMVVYTVLAQIMKVIYIKLNKEWV